MNTAQIKLSLVFLIFAIIGFGPISLGCLTGIYIVLIRPAWFKKLVQDLFDILPSLKVGDSYGAQAAIA